MSLNEAGDSSTLDCNTYYSITQMNVDNIKANETLIMIIELPDPIDYIPILNMICNKQHLEIPLSSFCVVYSKYIDLTIFDVLIRQNQLAKFRIVLRSYDEEAFADANFERPMIHAVNNDNLAMAYLINKMEQPFQVPQYYRIKNIKIALDQNKQKIIDALFNIKIIKLKWLELLDHHRSKAAHQFMFDSNRIVNYVFDKFNVMEIIESINVITLVHIVIFEMFDESNEETLMKLLQNKLDIQYLTETQSSRILMFHKMEMVGNLRNIYDFYCAIFDKRSDDVQRFIVEFRETNYDLQKDFLPLYIAIDQNNYEMAKILIYDGNIDFNVTDYQKTSLVHWSMKFQNNQILDMLDESMLDKLDMRKNDLSRYPIYYAIKFNNYSAFKYCLESKTPETDEFDIFEKSYLMLAAKSGHKCIFNDLIKLFKPYGTYLYTLFGLRITDYFSLLSIAVDRKNKDICQILLQDKQLPHFKSSLGITPLVIATLNFDTEMMYTLLAYDASINVKLAKDIYFRNRNQFTDDPSNLIKFTDNYPFADNGYYDDLLTFVLVYKWLDIRPGFFTIDMQVTLKIIIQQIALHNLVYNYDFILKHRFMKTFFVEYYRRCRSELRKMDKQRIPSEPLLIVRNILERNCEENHNEISKLTHKNSERLISVQNELLTLVQVYKIYGNLLKRKISIIFQSLLDSSTGTTEESF